MSPELQVLSGVWAFLVAATCIAEVATRRRPSLSPIRTTIHAWWPLTAIMTVGLLLGAGAVTALMALISWLALREYFTLVPTRRVDHRTVAWSFGAIAVQYLAVQLGWLLVFLLYIPLYHLLIGALRLVLRQETDGFVDSASHIHWGLMLAVFCISHVAWLAHGEGGLGLVIYLLVLTELNDVAQFLWGRSLGRRPVLPRVSPNKTTAGLVGGVCTTAVLSAALAPLLTPFGRVEAALFGLALGFFGFAGDVVLSAVKRDLGVKDTGTLIPGHGGVLDRVDSLTWTAPLVVWFTAAVT